MTHQKMNYAYRFTESSVEYCEWKDLPRWALPLLKWLAAITAVVFTFLATLDPTLIIGALIGPGGMALMYIRMAYSKSYRAIHTEYHHYFIRWCELTQATIATNRDMVELAYSIPKVNALYPTRGSQYVFYTRKDKPTVIDMLKRYLLDGTPCITDHIEVLN